MSEQQTIVSVVGRERDSLRLATIFVLSNGKRCVVDDKTAVEGDDYVYVNTCVKEGLNDPSQIVPAYFNVLIRDLARQG